MSTPRRFRYVGPDELLNRPFAMGLADIASIDTLDQWLSGRPERDRAEPFTYVVTVAGILRLAPRQCEHVACAGVQLTMGTTKTLDAVVAAAEAWTSGASLADLHARCTFLEITDLALAHEQGPAAAVTEKWHQLRTRWSADDRFRQTADVIEAAYADPSLRQLFPYTSHASLCFSACTGFPYSEGIPRIDLGRDGYVIRAWLFGDLLGEADTPQGALTVVLTHLPPDLGPAIEGTADQR